MRMWRCRFVCKEWDWICCNAITQCLCDENTRYNLKGHFTPQVRIRFSFLFIERLRIDPVTCGVIDLFAPVRSLLFP